ncbi:hypothetical protein [Acinetobacter variabilis]|uniref:DUF551 domain-containing protein n=1 Tax=Acinetobacter variabilis TaxID=70346 RepID=N8WUH0_9GAMM|nr:hypothetical protein [Acinetobacter variabilis]ENU98534.1 hypothetical protein F969_02566 [Acinetobacter variabilis]
MDIKEKQARWALEKPLFEAEFIHSHLLPFFNFNENTGDYEIKSECVSNTDDEDRKVAYEALNTGWVMWLRAKRDAKAQAVPEWIETAIQPPEEGQKVIISGIYGVGIAEFSYLYKDEFVMYDMGASNPILSKDQVKFWQPLPDAPQEPAND